MRVLRNHFILTATCSLGRQVGLTPQKKEENIVAQSKALVKTKKGFKFRFVPAAHFPSATDEIFSTIKILTKRFRKIKSSHFF